MVENLIAEFLKEKLRLHSERNTKREIGNFCVQTDENFQFLLKNFHHFFSPILIVMLIYKTSISNQTPCSFKTKFGDFLV